LEQIRLEACINNFTPPKRLYNASFDNYLNKTEQQKKAFNACKEYSLYDLKAGKGLLLAGSYGTGKTHLAVATVRNLISQRPDLFGVKHKENSHIYPMGGIQEYRGAYCFYVSMVELLESLRPNSVRGQEYGEWIFHRAKADDLLVLDDIGTEKPSEWVEEKIYSLIDIRYRMNRATIFTTNYTEKQLEAQLGGRTISRIYEMADSYSVVGPDHRRKGA